MSTTNPVEAPTERTSRLVVATDDFGDISEELFDALFPDTQPD